jgi:hypothetical protein
MRKLLFVFVMLAAVAASAGMAMATDEPPASVPGAAPGQAQPLQPAPPIAVIKQGLKGCKDSSRPVSGLGRSSARLRRGRALRGTARDSGCGVAMVTVSIVHKQGKRCRYLASSGRLTRPTRCRGGHWLVASGTTRWHVRMPRGLPRGRYTVRTRAVDFAGNVERIAGRHARRLRLG